jgi:hypothetical protein
LLPERADEARVKHIAHLVHVERHRLVWPVLFGAALVAGGCETSSTLSVSPSPDIVKCQVSLVSPPMIEAAGGTGALTVTTQPECAWDASTAVTWISGLSPASGQGTGNLEFRVAPNEDTSVRDGEILVNGTAVRVSQRATCRFALAPASQTISAAGGAGNVSVSTASDCAWTATADASWISFTTPSSGSGNGTVGFSVAANGGNERTGRIAIGGQTATVTQSFIEPCDYSIAPTSQNVGAAGGTGTVAVSSHAGCRWTATSNASWIAISSGSPGDGNGSVAFTVSTNAGAARTGTLTIAGRQFTVTQAGSSTTPTPSCTYSISPTSQNVPATGAAGTVSVSAAGGCAWTATSNASWITSSATGSGNGSVAFAVAANTGASRTGTITIATQTFTVTQAAVVVPQCQYSVSPNRVEVDAPGGTGSVAVSTASGCAWTASSGDSWITITSGASGTGNGTVTFSVARNDGRRREGSLTVAGRNVRVEQRDGRGDDDDDD